MARIEVSSHAVERFIQRIRPDWSYEAASAFLNDVAPNATRIPGKTLLGQVRYEVTADPACILVLRPSRLESGLLACITVYPPSAPTGEAALTDIERELLEELARRPAPSVPKNVAAKVNQGGCGTDDARGARCLPCSAAAAARVGG